jgi:hypothetical protein
VFPPYPTFTEGGKKVSPRCTRQRMAHGVGGAGYSSTLRISLGTRSNCRGCSKNYKASLRWRKKHSAWLTLILTVLIMIGVMTVLPLRATTLPGVSAAVNATVEEISFSSKSSSSQELPRTGGP